MGGFVDNNELSKVPTTSSIGDHSSRLTECVLYIQPGYVQKYQRSKNQSWDSRMKGQVLMEGDRFTFIFDFEKKTCDVLGYADAGIAKFNQPRSCFLFTCHVGNDQV